MNENDPRPPVDEPEWRSDPNAPVAPGDDLPHCDKCGNKRFVVDQAGNLHPCAHCGVAHRWRVQSVANFSSRNRFTESQTFVTFRTDVDGQESAVLRRCLRTAEKFAEAPDGKWLVIWGERGNGKSHLCAAVDNHLREAGVAVIFVTAPDLFAALRRSMDLDRTTEQESYSGRMRTFKEAQALILDDLGAETSSAWSEGVLFEILDFRYRNRLPTMIASNVPPEHFDPRLASRMQDKAFSVVLTNTAPDFRQRTDRKRGKRGEE
jgi:DNA replication protein DnaC